MESVKKNISIEELKNMEASGIANYLENDPNLDSVRLLLPILFEKIEQETGKKLQNDPSEIYFKMKSLGCLARVETLSRILDAIEHHVKIHIGDVDEHYANAVVPEGEGIELAFGEGLAPGPVRVMLGFGKSVIGFRSDSLLVESIEYDVDDLRDGQKRSVLCRHVAGDLPSEDIKFIVLRIPAAVFPDNLLKDDEKGVSRKFIFRCVDLTDNE